MESVEGMLQRLRNVFTRPKRRMDCSVGAWACTTENAATRIESLPAAEATRERSFGERALNPRQLAVPLQLRQLLRAQPEHHRSRSFFRRAARDRRRGQRR